MANEAEYFVALTAELYKLRALDQSAVLRLPPEKKERLGELEREVRERTRRMGFSVRRKVNEMLAPLGYPPVGR